MRPRLLSLLAAALFAVPAAAQEAEYRSFTLSDGRTLLGLVLESGAEGMTLRVPQGVATVPYALLSDIGTADLAAYESQGPLTIAVAPIAAGGADNQDIASGIDSWLSDAVAIIPATRVLDAAAWQGILGTGGNDVLDCSGAADCLAPLAARAGADRLLIPSLSMDGEDVTLAITALVTTSGATVADAQASAGIDAVGHAAAVLSAAFDALTLKPEIDAAAAAVERFPPAPPPVAAVTEPAEPGEPAADDLDVESTAEEAIAEEAIAEDAIAEEATPEEATPEEATPEEATPEEATPEEATSEEATSEETTPEEATATAVGRLDEELLRTVALGFVPAPGLPGAINKDLPAFITALVGGVGCGWAAVYAAGAHERTAQEFAGAALGSAYGIVVAWNQAASLVGLALRRRSGATSTPSLPPPPAVSLVPYTDQRGNTGAAVLFNTAF